MPPKKNPESPKEQADRFRKEAQKLIKDGDLDPKAAESAVEGLVRRSSPRQNQG